MLVRRLAGLALAGTLALASAAACSTHATEEAGAAPQRAEAEAAPRVLAISVDGLGASALAQLGPEGAPTLHRLLAEGAGTLDARTAFERTETLPDHTTQLTGRRIDPRRGGHGVTWNEHRPGTTVHRAAGERVGSVLQEVHRSGGETALFVAKEKLSLFRRSWRGSVDRFTLRDDPARLVSAARRDLRREERAFWFVHVPNPDVAGHAHGFGSPEYLRAVQEADRLVGRLLEQVETTPRLAESVRVVLTADHGGTGTQHGDARLEANYTIPFLVWGPGVDAGDLYAMNPDRRDPGDGRPGYRARRQPVRNGDLANLALDLLGLGPVPGSQMNAEQDLDVTAP